MNSDNNENSPVRDISAEYDYVEDAEEVKGENNDEEKEYLEVRRKYRKLRSDSTNDSVDEQSDDDIVDEKVEIDSDDETSDSEEDQELEQKIQEEIANHIAIDIEMTDGPELETKGEEGTDGLDDSDTEVEIELNPPPLAPIDPPPPPLPARQPPLLSASQTMLGSFISQVVVSDPPRRPPPPTRPPPRFGWTANSRVRRRGSLVSSITRTLHSCPNCMNVFTNESALNHHYVSVHLNTYEYQCQMCNLAYNDQEAFEQHLLVCDRTEPPLDNIPVVLDGDHLCPTCGNTYTSGELLGEHFIISHNNYQDLTKLDNGETDGFPGYDLLEYIGMLRILKQEEIERYMENKEQCNICYSIYKYEEPEYVSFGDYNDNGYLSDGELELDRRNEHKSRWNKRGRIRAYNSSEVVIPELVHQINKFRMSEYVPLVMACCNQHMCYDCLKRYAMATNSITCPFCKKDHTRSDLEYVKYIDMTDTTEKEKWESWWLRHQDVFYWGLGDGSDEEIV